MFVFVLAARDVLTNNVSVSSLNSEQPGQAHIILFITKLFYQFSISFYRNVVLRLI